MLDQENLIRLIKFTEEFGEQEVEFGLRPRKQEIIETLSQEKKSEEKPLSE